MCDCCFDAVVVCYCLDLFRFVAILWALVVCWCGFVVSLVVFFVLGGLVVLLVLTAGVSGICWFVCVAGCDCLLDLVWCVWYVVVLRG